MNEIIAMRSGDGDDGNDGGGGILHPPSRRPHTESNERKIYF